MKRLDLEYIENQIKAGDPCPSIQPNITESTMFYENGKPIGFLLLEMPENIKDFVAIANKEFRSDNVPKALMQRLSYMKAHSMKGGWKGKPLKGDNIAQYSTILGYIPPSPFKRRYYPSMAGCHKEPKAATFIKAMLLAAKASEELIKEFMPEQYKFQREAVGDLFPKDWRFSDLFTSSISNFNIAAGYHRDAGNVKECVNVIITKRFKASGGNLNVPDYGATMDSRDNSILVYPAWKNIHGVTPIEPHATNGYRS